MGIGSDTLASLKVIYNPAQMKLFPDTPFHMFSPRLVEMGSRFPHWVFTQKSNSGRENREMEREGDRQNGGSAGHNWQSL